MGTVFTLSVVYRYEPGYLVGVFTTREKAEAFRDAQVVAGTDANNLEIVPTVLDDPNAETDE